MGAKFVDSVSPSTPLPPYKEVKVTLEVTGAVIASLDEKFNYIPGTERNLEVDTICLAVGLSPLTELLFQTGCEMRYIPELCGYVALRDENLKTSLDHIYIAGDVTGIEEASSAMVEGQLAGLNTAASLDFAPPNYYELNQAFKGELAQLRHNEISKVILRGIEKATLRKGGSHVCST